MAVAGAKATSGTYNVRRLYAMRIVQSYIGNLPNRDVFLIGLPTLRILQHVPHEQSCGKKKSLPTSSAGHLHLSTVVALKTPLRSEQL